MNATELRSTAALALVYGTRMLGLFMLLPVFVLLGQDLVGATPLLLGLALGAYGLSQALLQIPFGLLSDRIGRKPLIYAGLLIFAVGSLVAASSDSIYGVIAGRVLQGAGAIASVLMALVSDLTREEHRTKAMAGIGLSIGLSFALSLVLGPLIGNWLGLSGLFALTALLALASMLLVALVVPNPVRSTMQPDAQPVREQLGRVLRMPRLLRLDFGIFVLHLALTAAFMVVPVLLQDRLGVPAAEHWWIYLSVMGAAFFAMLPFIIIGEKKRQLKVVMTGAVALLGVATTALVWSAQTLLSLWFVLFFFFMAFNMLEAMLPSLISKEAPAASKGSAMGVYSTSQFLGAFVGGTAGGYVAGTAGIEGVIVLIVGAVSLWLAVVASMAPPRHAASFTLRLNPMDRDGVIAARDMLAAVAGVEEVVILAKEQEAYLKVDKQILDEVALRQLPCVTD
ncbi:MAG: MFS transporter [Halomonadaceae bacterium]|nr:MAG: MFS transporter [Halomonadaceae bacterium]